MFVDLTGIKVWGMGRGCWGRDGGTGREWEYEERKGAQERDGMGSWGGSGIQEKG